MSALVFWVGAIEEGRCYILSRDFGDVFRMKILSALFKREVAGDAAAGQREQEVNIHGIDLDGSVLVRREKYCAIRAPGDAPHRSAVRREGDQFAPS